MKESKRLYCEKMLLLNFLNDIVWQRFGNKKSVNQNN